MAKKQTPAPAPVVEPVVVETPEVVVEAPAVEEVTTPVVEPVVEVTPEPVAKVETNVKMVDVTPTGSIKKTEDGKNFEVETATIIVATVENLKDLASKVIVRPGGTIAQRGGVTVHTLLTDAAGVQALTDLIKAVKAL